MSSSSRSPSPPSNGTTLTNEGISGLFPSFTNWYSSLNKSHALTILILVYVNLINYMDRSTVAGMIDYIGHDPYFNIQADKYLGLLQTAFVICYMIFAPIFGYLGDRYNRKLILGIGITFWGASTLLGSFCFNFWWFLTFRALVGIGEASYSTIAPAMISDLFSKNSRTGVLGLFYSAIPVGTGLGYMVGSEVASAASDWRWGLRVTPFMGLLAILMIVFFMVDPPRGQSEGSQLSPTKPKEDLIALAKNKSFILSTVGFTCVTFCAGALLWWGPKFAYLGAKVACGDKAGCENITQADISYRFGIVMTFAGLIGVPVGSYVSQLIRQHIPFADPLVCAYTLLLSVPVLFFGFVSAQYSIAWCYGLTFLAGLLLNCNWAIVSDITLYIVIPTRRSFASATQILVSHAFGDATSPYLIGAVSDAIRPSITPNHNYLAAHKDTPENISIEFRSLQYSLFACCFFQAMGALFFFVLSFYILDDKRNADRAISNTQDDNENEATPIIRNIYADEPEPSNETSTTRTGN